MYYVYSEIFTITEPIAFNEMSMRQNAAMLDYCRTSMSALSGATAGIIGLTGLYGFIFYFITALMLSVSRFSLKFNTAKYKWK